jgi:hypothetical protein
LGSIRGWGILQRLRDDFAPCSYSVSHSKSSSSRWPTLLGSVRHTCVDIKPKQILCVHTHLGAGGRRSKVVVSTSRRSRTSQKSNQSRCTCSLHIPQRCELFSEQYCYSERSRNFDEMLWLFLRNTHLLGMDHTAHCPISGVYLYFREQLLPYESYPRNRPWRPIALWYLTLSRQSAHRWRQGCQPYAPAALYFPEALFFYFWYSFLLEAEWITGPSAAGRIR